MYYRDGIAMKKTTVQIDDELLQAAMEASGARSKRAAIEKGLQVLIRDYNREELRKELGTFDIGLTLEELEILRHAG
jgi:Arc/MetJ family transcription regulator